MGSSVGYGQSYWSSMCACLLIVLIGGCWLAVVLGL